MNRLQSFKSGMVVAMVLATGAATMSSARAAEPEIRLVLQITVDGFRRDLIDRYRNNFGKGGFEYLLKNGTFYTNAHYRHANTETIVGHTTLATGAVPADHGMIGNAWYDRADGELAYNIEDPQAVPLATRDDEQAGEQLDPTQMMARNEGRSPRAILAETISDRLMAHYGGKSRVFAVSGKDRGAVPMAGHVGKAFWMSTDTGDFITSSYYYDHYPEWVVSWNERREAEKLGGQRWELLNDPSSYLLGHQDDRPYETDLRGYGRSFPHQFAPAGNPLLATQVLVSPYGDRLTADFAKTLIEAEQLGQDELPDFLGISFSGVDAVNHFFGPSSLENEDIVLQLDRTLADLIEFVGKEIGLEKTLIVVSADHGMAEMPEYLAERGFPAERLYTEQIVALANAIGQSRYEIRDIVKFFFRPYLYLDSDRIRTAGLDGETTKSEMAEALTRVNGINLAVNVDELTGPQASRLREQIQNTYHPDRAGDIYLVQEPYWFNFDRGPIATMHGSPWRYDTHVPVIFAGAGIGGRRVHRLVHPSDVAPTIAALLGMTPPASASGTILLEVLED